MPFSIGDCCLEAFLTTCFDAPNPIEYQSNTNRNMIATRSLGAHAKDRRYAYDIIDMLHCAGQSGKQEENQTSKLLSTLSMNIIVIANQLKLVNH